MNIPRYGVPYTVYFTIYGDDLVPLAGVSSTSVIKKDSGAVTSTSNSIVDLGTGVYTLLLTASEMQASNSIVVIDSGIYGVTIVDIHPGTNGGGTGLGASPGVTISRTISAGARRSTIPVAAPRL